MNDLTSFSRLLNKLHNGIDERGYRIFLRHEGDRQALFIGGSSRNRSTTGDHKPCCQRAHLLTVREKRAEVSNGGGTGEGHHMKIVTAQTVFQPLHFYRRPDSSI